MELAHPSARGCLVVTELMGRDSSEKGNGPHTFGSNIMERCDRPKDQAHSSRGERDARLGLWSADLGRGLLSGESMLMLRAVRKAERCRSS
jgi:hypothetical protein